MPVDESLSPPDRHAERKKLAQGLAVFPCATMTSTLRRESELSTARQPGFSITNCGLLHSRREEKRKKKKGRNSRSESSRSGFTCVGGCAEGRLRKACHGQKGIEAPRTPYFSPSLVDRRKKKKGKAETPCFYPSPRRKRERGEKEEASPVRGKKNQVSDSLRYPWRCR